MQRYNLRSRRSTLPPEIQLCILECLAEPDNSNVSRTRLSAYAPVCRRWQWFVEKTTFRRLTLQPHDIRDLDRLTPWVNPTRRSFVQHILLEIPIQDDHDIHPRWDPGMIAAANNLCFTEAVWDLWAVLSVWRENCHITVELGVISSLEMRMAEDADRNHPFIKFLEQDPVEATAADTQIWHLRSFDNVPTNQWRRINWSWQKRRLLGTTPVEFVFDEFHQRRGTPYPPRLPSARVIADILIRRQYLRNIRPASLSQMFTAAPCLQVIHLERWCYGGQSLDAAWDIDSAWLGHACPPSVKRFSFYEEFNTKYHQQPGRMRTARRNLALLAIGMGIELEHIAISFAIGAQDVFSIGLPPYWACLTTLALTSDILVSRSSNAVNRLLMLTAGAAKEMPQLQILEIWHYKDGNAGIFRYEKGDRSGEIVWLGTWRFELSVRVVQAWQMVLDESYGGYALGVGLYGLERPKGLGCVFPYLRLRCLILDDASRAQF